MADTQIQNTSEIQEITVDDLSKKIQETTNELNQLKNWLNNLSVEELQQKADELSDIENAILEYSEDLSNLEKDWSVSIDKHQLNILKSQINTLTASKDGVQKQIEQQTTEALTKLNQTVTKESDQKKWKWEKKWLSGWRSWLNKWQKWWVRIWWALAWLWILKLWRRIFGWKHDYEKEIPWYKNMSRREKRKARKNYKKELKTEKKSSRTAEKWEFRQRPFWRFLKWAGVFAWVWSGIYYLAHGLYTKNWWLKDLFDWERGKKLSFKDALAVAEWNIANQKDDKSMSYDIELKYLEESSEIEAYGQKVKINVKDRTIEWLWDPAIKFKKYEHMISAAIVVAYLKKNLSWKCNTNTPFNWSWTWRWNLNADGNKVVDWTWISWMVTWVSVAWVLAIVSWIFGWLHTWAVVWTVWWVVWAVSWHAIDADNILNHYMPELDSEYWLKSLAAYLNRQDCWQRKNQSADNITDSPIKNEVRECIKNIQDTDPELEERGWRRQFDAIPDPNNPNRYTIKSYWRDIHIEVSDRDTSYLDKIPWPFKEKISNQADKFEIKVLWISGWKPEIKTDLTKWNFWELKLPLKEWLYMSSLLWFFLDNFSRKWNEYPRFTYGTQLWNSIRSGAWLRGDNKWLFFSDPKLDTYALTEKKFEERMPTLFQNKDRFLEFLNDWIKDNTNVSIRKKK